MALSPHLAHVAFSGRCNVAASLILDAPLVLEEILDQRVTDGVASGQDHPPLHHPERISLVRNRMRNVAPVDMSRSAPKVAAQAGGGFSNTT